MLSRMKDRRLCACMAGYDARPSRLSRPRTAVTITTVVGLESSCKTHGLLVHRSLPQAHTSDVLRSTQHCLSCCHVRRAQVQATKGL